MTGNMSMAMAIGAVLGVAVGNPVLVGVDIALGVAVAAVRASLDVRQRR